MTNNPFYQLAPFIQEYIYRHKWEQLHEVQVRAIAAILDTPDHILISSATASGKTEAALLPIITDLTQNPAATIGVMYIGPLKALINDQFERLTGLLEDTDMPVQSWHGDVSPSKKERFLRRSQGIIQITPESLESMLINRHYELPVLFADLRYVIIDEIHAFIDSDRGRQIMCQLERLEYELDVLPRRVGLSATIGEPETVMTWMQGNTDRGVRLIEARGGGQVELGLEYFLLSDEEDTSPVVEESEYDALDSDVFFEHLHRMTQRVPKTLIFANSRDKTEAIITRLRQLSDEKNAPSFYHVHHGNISAALREFAEESMRDDTQPACVAATVTLELGIDIGQLDQVLQVGAPHSVSSFVQRLGRSGRRGGPARLFFYATEPEDDPTHIGEHLPWGLLQTIATAQLYLDERWIEPPSIPTMPLSLLYHQTMSVLKAHTELAPPQLARQVLSLSPFEHITQDDYRTLLHHLMAIDHLEQTGTGHLIIGVEAEKIVNNYRFYATFADEVLYRVRTGLRELGTLQKPPQVGKVIGLAGYAWRVVEVNHDMKVVYVERAQGKVDKQWSGGGFDIHGRIVQKIREVLLSENMYPYLHDRARDRLQMARHHIQSAGLGESNILMLAPGQFLLFPWSGSREFLTQELLFEQAGITVRGSYSPFYHHVLAGQNDISTFRGRLSQLVDTPAALDLVELVDETVLERYKFDEHVPVELLKAAFAKDFIDLPRALDGLQTLL